MATLDQIGAALKSADAAGNVEDARRLAAAYRAAQGGGASAEAAPPDPQQQYDAALAKIRATQFPQMNDQQWADYAAHTFAPDLNAISSNGSTFGLADEISSGLGALGSGVRQAVGGGGPGLSAYGDYQDLENARLNLAREKNGLLGNAVEIGTGLATMGPEKAVADALLNAGKVAPSLLRTMAEGGATGAAIGGVGGFTNSEGDVAQRLQGAVKGAGMGFGVGAAAPAAAKAVSAGIENVASALAARKAAVALGIDPEAAKFLQTRLAADDALSASGQARMAQAGQEATLADAGPSARNTLDYAIQSSGRAGQIAREEIGGRVTRDSAAVNSALDTALGIPKGAETARAEIRTTTAPARGSAYDTAYAQPIDYSSPDGRAIEELLQRVPKQAIDRANALMKIKGETSGQIMAQVADDGSVTFKTMPDVRQLDYITRGLNEEAKHGLGAGAMGGQTSLGSALEGLSGDIRDTLRLHVPAYGDALAAGQDAIRQSQAVKNGYELLRPGTTREDVGAWASNMTDAERTAAAQGVRSHISDTISNVTRTLNDGDMPAREALKVLRDLSTTASRDKVAQVIGKDAADTLFAELDRATKSFELRASVADNSKTFQRQEMDRQVNAVTNPDGIVAAFGRGEPVNAGKRAIQAVTGFTPERALAAKDAMMQDVVTALLRRGPGAVSTAQGLQALGTKRAGIDAVAKAIVRLGALGQPGAYQAGRLLAERRQ